MIAKMTEIELPEGKFNVFAKVFFDLANALFDLDKDCFIIVTTKIIAVLASPKLLFV